MVSCVVPDCHNYSEKTGEAASYHKFPQDHSMKAWLDRVRRVDMPPLETSYVCSEHFCSNENGGKVTLRGVCQAKTAGKCLWSAINLEA